MRSNLNWAPDVAANIAHALRGVIEFVDTEPFQGVIRELRSLAPAERFEYVRSVLLVSDELAKRGVIVPPQLLIQRSAFKDGRPTLFCVSKDLHGSPPWHKVTITFDNEGAMIDD